MNKQAHNYIFEYHDAIASGGIRAGKGIKAIYKILVEGIKNGEWVFDQKKANKAIKQLAESEKYDLIVQDVVWVSPKLDVTEKIIKALSEGK